MGRVPVATAPALDAGRLLHRIFERHFKEKIKLEESAFQECYAYQCQIPFAHPAARPGAQKSLQAILDLSGAWDLWEDKYKFSKVLEIEKQSEWQDPKADILWLLTPDRVVTCNNRNYHVQNRGLAAQMNFGTYTRLGLRHYHEHLYGEYIKATYGKYSGVIFNLVRKLKYKTNAGRKNEATKTAAEMFYQGILSINLDSPRHKAVMAALRWHVSEMKRVHRLWETKGIIPAPNEKMNGGFSGSSEDVYFKVLIGEVKLSNDKWFKDREERYLITEAE